MLRHIVIVSDAADGKGGASLAALQSAFALSKEDVQVHVFAATGPFPSERPGADRLRVKTLEDGLDLIRAPLLQRATQSLWNGAAASAFRGFVHGLDPAETVVHVHSFQVQLTASVVREAKDLGYLVAMTAHDYGLACPYSGFYHYTQGRPCGKRALSVGCVTTLCTQGRSVPGKLWHLAKGSLQATKGQVPSGIDHLICVSDFSGAILRPYLDPGLPVTLVRNPAEFADESPRELPADAPFLFVGRLTKEKGGVLFAEAARLAGVPAVFAGVGPEDEAIRAANPEARLLGWQTSAEVRRLMRAAKAFVFPSRWFETQGMVVDEARAQGLPAIVSDVTAARDAIRDGIDGWHFRSGDVEDLAAKLRAMDDDHARRMGLAAYDAYGSDPPTAAKHVAETMAVYAAMRAKRGWA